MPAARAAGPATLYRQLADAGNGYAWARLGRLHLEGRGVARDVARARELFQRTVVWMITGSHVDFHRRDLELAMGAGGIPPELEVELRWLERVRAGDPELQLATALRLKAGRGLPRDEAAARRLLRRAMLDGSVAARFELGMWELAEAANEEGRRWALGMVARAAKDGHVSAMKEIGLRLAEGRGVVRDDFTAYVLLRKARSAGEEVDEALADAASRLTEVARRLAEEKAHQPRFFFALGFEDD